MYFLAKDAGITDQAALQELHEAFQVNYRIVSTWHFSDELLQVLVEIVTANKNRFRKKAQATATVISMSKMLSPRKKKPTRANIKQKKQRRKSKIIVEDYDSKKVTDITDLVIDTRGLMMQLSLYNYYKKNSSN